MATAGDSDSDSSSFRNVPSKALSSSPTTAKEVVADIELWITSGGKLHSDVVRNIELKINRQLSRWEETWVERQYVKIVLKIWLKESLEKAFNYLENKAKDISTEMLSLFHQLDSVDSFYDISKQNASSRLLSWCDGERFQMILKQTHPFQTTFSSVALVSNYVNHLKNWCTDKVIARCLSDIAHNETNGKKQCDFISALHNFFTTVHKNNTDDMQLQDIMEEESLEKDLMDDSISGKELVRRMLEKISTTKSVGPSNSKLEIKESFRRLKESASNLEKIEWTPQLQSLTKETCKKSLLPITQAAIKDDDGGRRIIVVKGVSVSVGKMIKKISDLQTKMKAHELQIIGLHSVHVDWNLAANDWHGINVVVVTDKILVNGDVCWDVTGQHGTTQLNEQFQKGESGGNVLVVCNEMETIKDGRWTIVADGGDGGDGRNGPSLTTDNNTRKWSKENFKKYFPSMSTFSQQHKSEMSTVLKTLNEIMPLENRDHETGATKLLPDRENFYVEGTAKDGSRITVSFLSKKNQVTKKLKKRCTLILCQGGRGGQGGYGGSITFEHLNGEPFVVPSSLLVGTKKLPAMEMHTGVYQALQGKNGRAIGDVGFIHCVDVTHGKKNREGNYIGFDNDVKLKIEYLEHKPHDGVLNSYTPINPLHAEGHQYAKIIPKENQDTFESCNYSVMDEAGKKKKAITRQSLEQYFVQIAERKRMTLSFQAIYSTNFSQTSSRQQLGDIESFVNQIENKQSLLQQQLTSQRFAEVKVGEGQYVKPAFFRRVHGDGIPKSFENILELTSECRPVDFQSKPKPTVDVRCLNVLPTMGGVESALHSIYGKKNSAGIYFCRDPKRHREKIAEFIRSQEKLSRSKTNGSNCKIFTFIEQFVKWRVRYGDFDFPTASSMKDAYLKNNTSINRESTQKFYKSLLDEYARFIEFPSSTLDINEMEILAIDCDITIHIYENHLYSFKYKTTLNSAWSSDRSKTHFVLYERGGEWQRLEANEKLQTFCIELDKQFFKNSYSVKTPYFTELMKRLEINCSNQNIITSVKKFNPLDGETPDQLSQLLAQRLKTVFDADQPQKKRKLNDEKIAQLAADLHFLSEIVLEYNNRNISQIFYLHIVARFEPHEWKDEFLLLEIEQRLTKELSYDEKSVWRKNLLYQLNRSVVSLLRERILATDKQPRKKLVFDSEERQLEKILRMLVKDLVDLTEVEVTHLGKLPLSDWYYELRCKVWQKKIDLKSLVLKTRQEGKSLKRKAVYMLMDLEMKRGEEYCRQLMDGIKDLQDVVQKLEGILIPKSKTNRRNKIKTAHTERQVSDIISSMKNDTEKSLERRLEYIGNRVEESKQMQLTANQITDLISNEWLVKGIDLTDGPSLVKFLYVFDYAVRKTFQKKKLLFQLRDTQRVAIMTLLTNYTMMNLPADLNSPSSGTLVQIATGEGKSLIVAGTAIAFALSRLPNAGQNKGKNKVDVITSNKILACRDSHLPVDQGGLRDLYEFFKINVNNNCSQSEYNRIKAYDSDVVYGELSNFQRDYLLDKFYDRNIRGDRTFDFVIVDEVDCMLLDRSNNTLYLSHDIPGMEMLESLYVFIWEKIHQSMERDDIKSAVLFDLYGVITKNNLNSIHAPLKDHPSEKNALWNHLIEKKVIDSKGRLLIEDVDKITEKTIDYKSTFVRSGLNHHLIFFFRNVAKRERRIRIPEHLLSFVDRHLDSWLDNALRSLQLRPDEDYVVDQDRTLSKSNTSMDLEPQVIIIDPDTGMDQTSLQWDGALHQFLQLKEGCKLTLQSLKAVFVSNATYIKLYGKIAGVSGTLGSERERKFMMGKYKCNFFNIPTAFPKSFTLKSTKVYKTKESWLETITEEARQTVCPGDKTRSIIIFCQSIKEVNIVFRHLKKNLTSVLRNDNSKINCYTRDYEKFTFESAELDVGHVIVATNLAGRGTNINITQELYHNGGLHVCLTYLPDNERVEEQAMGRSGRNGAPGSGILILYEAAIVDGDLSKAESEWHVSKVFSMKGERNYRELQRVSRMKKDSNSIGQQESFFDKFSLQYNKMKSLLLTKKWCHHEIKIVCDSALDQWALWLDLTSEDVKSLYRNHDHDYWLTKQFATQLSECKGSLIDITWITPSHFLNMVKNIANQSKKVNLSPFHKRLMELMESKDSFFYPAAHYYQAFILINEDIEKNKKEIIRTLRTCETILYEHIAMQNSFHEIVDQTLSRSGSNSFCVVEAYRQQKDNVVKLLCHFIRSIWSFLGTNYVSVMDLQMHTGMTQNQKAEEVFNKLTDSRLIVCHVNDPKTVPNHDAVVQKVAEKYSIKRSSIDEYLNDARNAAKKSNGLKEKEMKKKLKCTKMIPNSRKDFWNFLIANEVLNDPIECGIISQSDCDNMSLDRKESIKMDPVTSNCIPVLYDPVCTTQTDMQKIMFKKSYLKEKILEYRNNMPSLQEPTFESNKYACLNLDKLKVVDLKSFGYLKKNDFFSNDYLNIDRNELANIWNELRNQNIIDDKGDLESNYKEQEFRYPECPNYEDSVNRLIKMTFAVELVRRDWLKAKENPSCLQAITQLPLKPYRHLLNDLCMVHIVSGPQVNANSTLDLKKVVKIIEDKQECECVMEFLQIHRPSYISSKNSGAYLLDSIERDIRASGDVRNISIELYIFCLMGFDHAIKTKDRKITWMTISTILIMGVLQMAIGIVSKDHLRHITRNPGVGGLQDILFLVKCLRNNQTPTMAGYRHYKIRKIILDSYHPVSQNDVMESWLVNPEQRQENYTDFLKRIQKKKQYAVSFEDATTPLHVSGDINKINLIDQVKADVSQKLQKQCHLYGIALKKRINKVIVNKNSNPIKETLSHLHRLHGLEGAQHLVNEKMNELTTNLFERGQKKIFEWLKKVDKEIKSALSNLDKTCNSHGKGKQIGVELLSTICYQVNNITNQLRDFDLRIEIMRLIVKNVGKFHLELEGTLETTSQQNYDVQEREMTVGFENKVMADMKSEIAEKIDRIIELLAPQIITHVTNHFTLLKDSFPQLFEALSQINNIDDTLITALQNSESDTNGEESSKKTGKQRNRRLNRLRTRLRRRICILM